MAEAAQTQAPTGYVDGGNAEAFQGLIDRGLFNDAPAEPVAPTPQATQAAPAVQTEPPAEPPAEPTPEPQAEEYHSLDEYLTKSNLDREAFLSLPVTVKVDGAESQVPLAALLRSYQLDAHVTQRSQAVAEAQRKFDAEQAQAKQTLTQNLQGAQTLAKLAHQQLFAEFQGIDWNRMRAEDPAQWAARNEEFRQRDLTIRNQLAQIDQLQQQQTQQSQVAYQQQLITEQQKMLEAFPEWKDPAKRQAAQSQIRDFAKSFGFNDAEIDGIADHRYLKILEKARLYDALQAKSPAVLKLVRAAPPMAAPGARQTRSPQTQRLQQVREAGRTGKLARNEDAQAAAFSALVDAGA